LSVAIRLTRVGATKRPAYRVIAIDKRRSRDGRALEILGFYDPLTEPATVQLETDRIKAWIGKGAQPSDMVVRLMRQADETAKAGADAPTPKRATRPAKAKPSKKAAAKAAAPAPEPVAEAPEAVAEAPEAVAETAEPVAEAPEAVAESTAVEPAADAAAAEAPAAEPEVAPVEVEADTVADPEPETAPADADEPAEKEEA
jgi:small subunit ribosomal protein S16